LDDVFNRLKDSVDIKMSDIEIPNAIFMEFDAPAESTHKLTFAMSKPFKKAFQMGTSENMLGNEEDLEMLHLTIRYNEIKKAAAHRGWGIDFNDLSWTGLYGTLTPKFVKAYAEFRGRRIREALMLTVAEELTKAPVSLKQQFNPNVFICGTDITSMPAWDSTDLTAVDGSADSLGFYNTRYQTGGAGTYAEAIADAMIAASGSGETPSTYLTSSELLKLEYYCRVTLKLNSLSIGKRRGYIFLVPSIVALYLKDPAVTGSIASYMTRNMDLSQEEMSIPGMLGRVGNLWLVEDERAPTLTLGGANGSWTLTPGFMQHGDNDDRNQLPWSATSGSVNYVYEVGYVLGAGALAEWLVNPVSYAKESTEYGKNLGKGSWMCGGIQLCRFEKDSGGVVDGAVGTRTLVQKGSCMVIIPRKAI
jgi:hypothetical protein